MFIKGAAKFDQSLLEFRRRVVTGGFVKDVLQLNQAKSLSVGGMHDIHPRMGTAYPSRDFQIIPYRWPQYCL